MCGLSGAVGTRPNMLKLKILGIINETRGEHSAGIYCRGDLMKAPGLYRDLVLNVKVEDEFNDGEPKVVLQHTRKATWGAKTKENAHPFEFSDDNDTMHIMHNGSLDQVHKLRTKYGVDKTYEVDSQVLGHIIFHNPKRLTSVLKSYEGAAALAWTYKSSPDTLYLWKGASRNTKYEKDLKEERPLFYYKDSVDDTVYFSSIENSLKIIREKDEDKIIKVPNNKILKFKSSTLVESIRVKRVGVKYEEHKAVVESTVNPNDYAYGPRSNVTQMSLLKTDPLKLVKGKLPEGFQVTHPNNLAKGRVYWFQGRCFRNGHVLDGIEYISDGMLHIRSKDSEKLYFYCGYLLKDYASYQDLSIRRLSVHQLQNNHLTVLLKNIHKSTFVLNSKGQVYNSNGLFNGGKIIPKFSLFEYNVDVKGNLIGERFLIKRPVVESKQMLIKDFMEEEVISAEAAAEITAIEETNSIFLSEFNRVYKEISEMIDVSKEFHSLLNADNYDKLEQLEFALEILEDNQLAENLKDSVELKRT